jgi:hypothetical protein
MECECTISSDMAQPGKICRLHFAYMEQAVAAERERCARIADGCPGNPEIGGENWTADYIAREIRKGAAPKGEARVR